MSLIVSIYIDWNWHLPTSRDNLSKYLLQHEHSVKIKYVNIFVRVKLNLGEVFSNSLLSK